MQVPDFLTEIDRVHASMSAAPDDDRQRLAFYECVADSEMFLLLSREAEGDAVDPALFDVEEGRYVLAFDREERLAEFAGAPAPYLAVSGRALARMLAGQGIGLALNPDVAPSSILLAPAAVDWLVATLDHAPKPVEDLPDEVFAPHGVPESVLNGLSRKLATAAGLAEAVWLAGVRYRSGARGHLLAFADARPGAEPALAAAAGEALTFSGVEAGTIDVVFLASGTPLVAALSRVGLKFDLPLAPQPTEVAPPAAPGTDPERPPRLR